ncbi:MAG TPA: hypothetical protein VGL58_14110 [Caulobacteraceae bacterium]|jgi:ElaB/YqjD/DUF883 family membrane-anchored ribosome-binding protein
MSDLDTAAKATKRAAKELAGEARGAIENAADRASDTYETARDLADSVDPFVRDRPYLSLAIAGLAGLVIGGLMAPTRPKVIYVKPRA